MRCLCALHLLLLILCTTTTVIAQSTDATISGLVLDPSGRVIPNADIEILNESTRVIYSGKTNETGIYTVSILPPGQYRLQVSKIGFKSLIKPGIVLNVQSAVAMNFTLPIGATSETVTVGAGASLINTTDASVSTVIDRKFVENIGLNGRSFQDLISMTPGVVTQSPQNQTTATGSSGDFSVNGQRTESNYYTVDGVAANIGSGYPSGGPSPATAGAVAGSTALGTTQSLLSVDALQEFRVESSTYSAEYGRAPGGQFSLLSRSGTNDLRGTLFDYLRNDVFDANDWFNDHLRKQKTALRQNDFGGALGGPISIPGVYNGRDRTFFFGSYEGLRSTQPQAATIEYVPSLSLRAAAPVTLQPILNAFPLPSSNGVDYHNGLAQFIEPYSLPNTIDSTSVRLDHLFTSRTSLWFRMSDTPSSISTRYGSAVTVIAVNSQTYTLGATNSLSSAVSNEFHLGYAGNNASQTGSLDTFGGATPIDLATAMGLPSSQDSNPTFDLYLPSVGVAYLETAHASNLGRQWNVVDTFNLSSGRHQFRLGIDYRRIRSPFTQGALSANPIFESSDSILTNSADILIVQAHSPAAPVFDEMAAYAQDEWRVTPAVTLSLGLRWEVDPPPTGAHDNDAYTLAGNINNPISWDLAPRGTPLWKTAWYNYAPRLGVAWLINDVPGQETVLRGGGGAFFDSANNLAGNGFDAVGFLGSGDYLKAPLPVTPEQLDISTAPTPPYSGYVVAFPTHLQLPYTLEWNVSAERALGRSQTITTSYVGSNGRRLSQLKQISAKALNPNFSTVEVAQSGVTSNYQALQVMFQRTMIRGIQALTSYTWSHALDYGSADAALPLLRGNSDFDVRHNFQGGLSWDLPTYRIRNLWSAPLDGWGLDVRIMARTGFPVTLRGNLLIDPASGSQYYGNLNTVKGESIYLKGFQSPGGRVINRAAFSLPVGSDAGDAPRNFVRGFGELQTNCAVRRNFHLYQRLGLQFRAEAFNLFNRANFGYIDPGLTDAQFGVATMTLNQSLNTVSALYQQGGARSMQFALRLTF